MNKLITNLQILMAERQPAEDNESSFVLISDDFGAYVGKAVKITDLNLAVRTAVFCNKEGDEFIPDFDGTMIYDISDTSPEKYIYYEQDDVRLSLYNYLTATGASEASKLLCA